MGNSESHTAAAAASSLADIKKKEKKRCKKFACCCVWCNVAAIVSLVVGIVLLTYFASSLHGNYTRESPKPDIAKALSYTGIAFLILGVILVLVGALLVFLLVATYRRFTGKSSSSKPIQVKQYSYGTAPYPQQDWGEVPNPHHPEASHVPAAQATGGGVDLPPPYSTTDALITPEIKAGAVDSTQIVPEIH